MSIKDKILVALSAIGAIFSAVFFVLFKQSKTERKVLEKELEEEKEINEHWEEIAEKRALLEVDKRIKDEEVDKTVNDIISGNRNNSDILSDLAAKSKNRVR